MIHTSSLSYDLYINAKYDFSCEAIIDIKTIRSLTYAELIDLSRKIGHLAERLGLKKGDTVLSLLPNSLPHMLFFIGLTSSGFSFAPLCSESTLSEIEKAVEILEPKLILISPFIPLSHKTALEKKTTVYVVDDFKTLSNLPPHKTLQFTAETSEKAILYVKTSGTTGQAKFIAHSINTLWAAAKSFVKFHAFITPQNRFLNIFNMNNFASLFNTCLIPLAARSTIVYDAEFLWYGTAARIWRNVDSHKVTILWLTPALLQEMVGVIATPLQSFVRNVAHRIQAVFVGMWNVNHEHKRIFMEEYGIPVLENYALTETTFISCESFNEPRQGDGNTNHSGKILPWVEILEHNADIAQMDSGHSQNNHNVKDIFVKSPYMGLGYVYEKNKIAPFQKNEKGFFPTQDLGFLTREGKLKILGRKREIIRMGGDLVNLVEIEAILQKHPAVDVAASVCVQHKTLGESYVLFLKIHAHANENHIDFESWVHEYVPRRMWPAQVIFTNNIPLTANGKICKWALAQHYKDGN